MSITKSSKIAFCALLIFPIFSLAEDFKLNPKEIELLKKTAMISPVEPWNPKKEWPSIINDDGTFDYGDKVPRVKQQPYVENNIVKPSAEAQADKLKTLPKNNVK